MTEAHSVVQLNTAPEHERSSIQELQESSWSCRSALSFALSSHLLVQEATS
jgi:hypothetical protein